MKKLICAILLAAMLFGFHQISAQTCGDNVQYDVSGQTTTFSKINSGAPAEWISVRENTDPAEGYRKNCGNVFSNDPGIRFR